MVDSRCQLVLYFTGNAFCDSLSWMQAVASAGLQRNEENWDKGVSLTPKLLNCFHWDLPLPTSFLMLWGFLFFFFPLSVNALPQQYKKPEALPCLSHPCVKKLYWSEVERVWKPRTSVVSPRQQQSSSGSSVCRLWQSSQPPSRSFPVSSSRPCEGPYVSPALLWDSHVHLK